MVNPFRLLLLTLNMSGPYQRYLCTQKITQAKIYLNSIKKIDHTCVVFIIWPASFCNAAP